MSSYHIIGLSDSREENVPDKDQKGYTTRVVMRGLWALAESFKPGRAVPPQVRDLLPRGEIPSYESVRLCGVKNDFSTLMSMDVPSNTIVVAMRLQGDKEGKTEQARAVLSRFMEAGAFVFPHIADPHFVYPAIMKAAGLGDQMSPKLVERADYQTWIMNNGNGIITSSLAKVPLCEAINASAAFIPDSFDFASVRSRAQAPCAAQKGRIRVLMLGYPFHHAAFYEAACELVQSKLPIDLTVCTSLPKASEDPSHTPRAGSAEHYFKLLAEMEKAGQLKLVPYDVATARMLQVHTDVILIPGDDPAVLNPYQVFNNPLRGDARLKDAVAAGAIPLVTGSYPVSYAPAIQHEAALSAASPAEGVARCLTMKAEERTALLENGADYVAATSSPCAVARKLHAFFMHHAL